MGKRREDVARVVIERQAGELTRDRRIELSLTETDRRQERSSWFDRYTYTWVELYAENGEFRTGNVRNWRKFIERANEHQESTGHKRCFKDAKEIIASEAKQDDSLLSVNVWNDHG